MAEIKIGGKIIKPHKKIKEEVVNTSKKRETKKSTKVDK